MRKYNITVNGKTYQVEVEEVGGSLTGRGHIRPASSAMSAPVSAPAAAPASADGGAELKSGIAGKVFKVLASAGQAVKNGDTVIVLEAMKMEIPIVATKDGTIADIKVSVGDAVETGQVLATLN